MANSALGVLSFLFVAGLISIIVLIRLLFIRAASGIFWATAPGRRTPKNSPSTAGTGATVHARHDFFSDKELAFHKSLTGATSGKAVAIYPKVRVLDIVEPDPGPSYWPTNNRLLGQHVDWLLVEFPTFKPLVAIELDGASHNRRRQRNADANKASALAQAGLPLLRFSNQTIPDPPTLRNSLLPYLPSDLTTGAPQPGAPPGVPRTLGRAP